MNYRKFFHAGILVCMLVALLLPTVSYNSKAYGQEPDAFIDEETYNMINSASSITKSFGMTTTWPGDDLGSWLSDDSGNGIVLADNGKGCEIVVDNSEESWVKKAADFLAQDIEKISGYRPPIVTSADKNKVSIRLVTLGLQELPEKIAADKLKGQWEAFHILTHNGDVWLVGSNSRGTAFASYTLSERLGIDPLYLWTCYEPEKHDKLVLKELDYFSGPPTFKFRGTFHDDEDILPRPLDYRGWPDVNGTVPMEWYERYFETILRLKMNIVAPYTRTRRRYEVQKTASDWGLFYTSHHYDILLSNPYGMYRHGLAEERGITGDWDWYKNRENMLKYWRAGVEENKDLNCIWPLGLRGTEDLDYFFPDGTTDEEKDAVYLEVINEQIKMVKELLPEGKEAYFHLNLYGGMLEQYKKGNIQLPPDVMLVWPDNVLGKMQALPGPDERHKCNGVYYHLAFCPSTLQMTHQVQPWRVTEEFAKIVEADATQYMLVNVSEMRDYVKELYLIAKICWDTDSTLSIENPSQQFINWWSVAYFGEDAAPDVIEAYRYYDMMLDNHNRLREASDTIYNVLYPELKKKFKGEEYSTFHRGKERLLGHRLEKYEEAVEYINSAISKMNPVQKRFFQDQMLGLKLEYWQSKAALILAQALEEPDLDKAWELVEESLVPLEQLEADIKNSEYPPFEDWYRESWARGTTTSFNLHRSYRLISLFYETKGKKELTEPKPPVNRPPTKKPPVNETQKPDETKEPDETKGPGDGDPVPTDTEPSGGTDTQGPDTKAPGSTDTPVPAETGDKAPIAMYLTSMLVCCYLYYKIKLKSSMD